MFYKIETHMHTSEVSACAPDSAQLLVEGFVKAGYDAVIVTDHFVTDRRDSAGKPWAELVDFQQRGYRAAVKAAEGTGLKVFFGWEMSRDRGEDYLTYGLTPEFLLAHPELPSLSTREYCRVCREAGGMVIRAHPFRQCSYIPPNPTIDETIVDGIEVSNSRWGAKDNDNPRVLEWARQHPHVPRTSGTDIHLAKNCGVSGIALTEPMTSLAQFMQAVRECKNYLIIDGVVCDWDAVPVES